SNSSQFDVLFNGQHKWDLENDERLAQGDLTAEWANITIAGVIGTQVISLNFFQLTALDFVIIQSVAFVGIRNRVGQPSPCPAGYFAQTAQSTGCLLCPANTYSNAAAANCTACAANEYARLGSSACSPRPLCTAADWQLSWT